MSDTDAQRRQFLKTSLGAAAVAIAPGMLLFETARGNTEAASSKVRWGMLIDTAQCTQGCNDCVTACNKENGLSGGTAPTDSQWIRKIDLKDISSGHELSLPMMCQHCAEPPCVDVCPTAASFKRADGIVLVDRHRCIGCRYCMMACPYKARSFVHEPLTDQKPDVPRGKGTVESCTLCVQRIDKGQQPACAEACKNKAILFGNLNDENSEIAKKVRSVVSVQVRADLQLNTGIRYQGL
ncbi:sulfate reduction electron transfer complex DsrMKJOP subunit DsrO [Sideroxydans lithotrophicus]|uniref:4Fe-4S ferredoxin iron-sulfur binding domain protein n=1 Tax=Sideroxydans lithotrophicus (strain ES-1) TaxID=580332 RepID=D5CSH3_SIDLE|nr:4Fe-4S dicluster domain-containing protein [Sideroxydans lithotrophicus]ADE11909.1 4Fe-4S ferredoxin iron-sulfur binding domain protein [Sideroxydans lithotrophicus ES-1]